MKIIISTVFVVLLVSIAQAGIFTTSPVSSTVWTAQSPQTITWINDNKDPPLAQLTNVKIELMTGQQQQVSLLTIGDGIQGTALKFDFQQGVPTNLGPSGQFYFLKFSNGAYTGFSARFTINGINGTLPNAPANNTTAGNSTSTSPYSGSGNSTSGSTGGSTGGSTSGSTSGSTGGSSGSSSANSTSTTSSTKPTATATSSNKPSSTNKTSGANSLGAVHVATFVIALVGLIISNWI